MNHSNKGKLVVIAAPSGAGKTSLVRALIESDPNIEVAVSHTTRAKRPHETDGVDYNFVSESVFKELIAADGFIEHAVVFGNLYGTSRLEMQRIIDSGKHLVLEIDWQGAEQVRHKVLDAISIFILPPSLETLLHRLQSRAQDDEATIQRRMSEAMSEISHLKEFGYLVVNDEFDEALDHIRSIISLQPEEFSLEQQLKTQKSLLSQLLSSSP